MTETILNKLVSGSATPKESLARIRYAAAFEHLCKPFDWEFATELAIPPKTLAAWRLRPEWAEAVEAIRRKLSSTSPKLRACIYDMARDGSHEVRKEVVETVIDMAFPPAKNSEIAAKPCR